MSEHMTPPRIDSEIPEFGTAAWDAAVRRMVAEQAPRRFTVVGHDPQLPDSAILGWGLDYGTGCVVVDAADATGHWWLTEADQIRGYFPAAPRNGIDIIWHDRPAAGATTTES